jgi:hypothetical protein
MNRNEATTVLGALAAAWPNTTVSEQTALVWMDSLSDIDADDAMTAARRLIRKQHWFPSIHQFITEAEAEAHARRNRSADALGLPKAPWKASEPPVRLVAAARRLLADAKAAQHDHHGPHPCPICGGVRPAQSSPGDPAA